MIAATPRQSQQVLRKTGRKAASGEEAHVVSKRQLADDVAVVDVVEALDEKQDQRQQDEDDRQRIGEERDDEAVAGVPPVFVAPCHRRRRHVVTT